MSPPNSRLALKMMPHADGIGRAAHRPFCVSAGLIMQVCKAQRLGRGIGDVACKRLLSLAAKDVFADNAHAQAKELENLAHPAVLRQLCE